MASTIGELIAGVFLLALSWGFWSFCSIVLAYPVSRLINKYAGPFSDTQQANIGMVLCFVFGAIITLYLALVHGRIAIPIQEYF
jgi:hypothetical protein